jgi:hypothetical protein
MARDREMSVLQLEELTQTDMVTPRMVAHALAQVASDRQSLEPAHASSLTRRLPDVFTVPPDDPAFEQGWPLCVDTSGKLHLYTLPGPEISCVLIGALYSGVDDFDFDYWWASSSPPGRAPPSVGSGQGPRGPSQPGGHDLLQPRGRS